MPSISPQKLSCTIMGGGCLLPLDGESTKTRVIARRLRSLWTGPAEALEPDSPAVQKVTHSRKR